jgi:hypothetical protein
MAIDPPRALRVRALDTLSLLVSGKNVFSATFATYTPPRRSRPIDASICAIEHHILEPNPSSSTYILLQSLFTKYERTNERNARMP